MPLQQLELVVVIPIGPASLLAHVQDTVESVLAFTTPSRKIILADDSGKGIGNAVAERLPGFTVLASSKPHGMGGGLYLTLGHALAYAVKHCRFDALLRLDTDALVIGPYPERTAIEMFRARPNVAMGGEIYHDNCSVRARLEDAAGAETTRARLTGALRRPYSLYRWRHFFAERTLGQLYRRAQAHGYTRIDYVFGGSNFMSEGFLRALFAHGLLPHPHLGLLNLQEDHLFGMLAAVVRMEIVDLSTESLPFGTAWKTLPASPADLIAQGKLIVHSARRWQEMDEDAIRAEFRAHRRAHSPESRLCE